MIKKYSKALLENLRSKEDMHLFPKYDERVQWNAIDIDLRRMTIVAGEPYINYDWPQLKAATYKQFVKDGLHEGVFYKRFMERRHALGSLLIAECAEGKGRFMEDLINGVFAICEESTWVVPQHNVNMNKAVAMDAMTPCDTAEHIDLFAAETGALMTWCLYLMEDAFNRYSINIAHRIKKELKIRIMKPYLTYSDYFWMGYTGERKFVNNWNPWINCNCMTTYLMACDDPEMRQAGVGKVLESAQFYIDLLGDEGGCNEGPVYWSVGPGKLFELMEQVTYASDNQVDLYSNYMFKNMGSYIYKLYIGYNGYVNFADAVRTDNHKDGGQIYRFGKASGDLLLQDFGQSIYQGNPPFGPSDNVYRVYQTLHALFLHDELMAKKIAMPYCQSGFINDVEIAVGRHEADSLRGLYFAAKGGSNGESHNHNDVGQVLVYHNAQPVLLDAGRMAYTKAYFGPERYEFWVTQSDYHNVPTVNGCSQKDGLAYKALEVTMIDEERLTGMEMFIHKAYPKEAGINSWKRSIGLYRESKEHAYITLSDAYELANSDGMTCLNYMTVRKPHVIDECQVRLEAYEDSPEILLSYTQGFKDIYIETLDLTTSPKIQSQWGDRMYRIRFVLPDGELCNERIMTVRPIVTE